MDPVEIVGSNMRSQQVLDLTVGDNGFRYGAISNPPYKPFGPLTANVSVLGPGTLVVKEIINYFLFLDEIVSSSANARFLAFYGHFEPLCWELLQPSLLGEVVA